MRNLYKWLLPIPVLIILLGVYLLLTGEAIIKTKYGSVQPPPNNRSQDNIQRQNQDVPPVVTNDNPESLGADLKSNRDSAYPYFLLGAGLLIVLGVLPRLGELSL